MLIRHKGSLQVPQNTPETKIRFVSFDPMKVEYYLVVSSIEEALEICPDLFIFPLEKSEQETMADLRANSLEAKNIDRETSLKIRSKYSVEAEFKALRTNDQEYKTFIEQVVSEHNAAKDALFAV